MERNNQEHTGQSLIKFPVIVIELSGFIADSPETGEAIGGKGELASHRLSTGPEFPLWVSTLKPNLAPRTPRMKPTTWWT